MTKVNCDNLDCTKNTNFMCNEDEVIYAKGKCMNKEKRTCSGY